MDCHLLVDRFRKKSETPSRRVKTAELTYSYGRRSGKKTRGQKPVKLREIVLLFFPGARLP